MRITRSILLLTIFFGAATAQDSTYLRVVLPDSDTLRVAVPRYRIAASTNPVNRAFINGVEARVYPTGAFAGLFRPDRDTANLQLLVTSPAGDSLTRSFVFIRPEPLRTSPHDTLVIDQAMMLPVEDHWLVAGDILEVQFKGSPGWEATFTIPGVVEDAPMRELEPRAARGLMGVYAGKATVKPGDVAEGVPVEFRLKRSFWSSEYATSRARVWVTPDSLPRTGEVVGRRPFLNVGLGTDRLGGAKLGYIEPGGRVNITGKVGRQFRVRLSEQLTAWIPEENVRLLPTDVAPPSSLTNSISVTGDSTDDLVIVGLGERLPYSVDMASDPVTVIVDVFGATSNTNWITHHLSAAGIESVSWNQVAADQYRLNIHLKHGQHWGTHVDYVGNSLRIRIRRPPVVADTSRPLQGHLFALDAGHGGENQGARGATGVREMDLTLLMVQQLDSVMQARGARTVLTRTGDEGPGMNDRAEMIVRSGARALISIHCNSTGETADPFAISGTGMFYRYVGFKSLADIMYGHVLKTGLNQFGVVGSFNFSLNGPTQLPNVLAETAFLSNPEDEMKLLDPDFRRDLAIRLADGLEEFVRTYASPVIPAPTDLQ